MWWTTAWWTIPALLAVPSWLEAPLQPMGMFGVGGAREDGVRRHAGAVMPPDRAVLGSMRDDFSIMTAWFVVIVPIAIMLFAVLMERLETRLRHVAVRQDDVEEFLEQARPDEVRALYGHGMGRALELFRGRRTRRVRRNARTRTGRLRKART